MADIAFDEDLGMRVLTNPRSLAVSSVAGVSTRERLVLVAKHELTALTLDAVSADDDIGTNYRAIGEGDRRVVLIVGDDGSAHVDGNAELLDSVEEGLMVISTVADVACWVSEGELCYRQTQYAAKCPTCHVHQSLVGDDLSRVPAPNRHDGAFIADGDELLPASPSSEKAEGVLSYSERVAETKEPRREEEEWLSPSGMAQPPALSNSLSDFLIHDHLITSVRHGHSSGQSAQASACEKRESALKGVR